MKRLRLEKIDVPELVAMYRSSAAAHGAATENGDYRNANRHHDVIASIYRELRTRGGTCQTALLALLDDIDPYVRTWAAAHALEFAPDRGEPVLRRLSRMPGFVGLTADMTLQEWSKGSLSFP